MSPRAAAETESPGDEGAATSVSESGVDGSGGSAATESITTWRLDTGARTPATRTSGSWSKPATGSSAVTV